MNTYGISLAQEREAARVAEQKRGAAVLAEQLAERELQRLAEEERREMVHCLRFLLPTSAMPP